MAKVAKTVGMIAGVAAFAFATVATFGGAAVAGASVLGLGTVSGLATAAGLVATAANIGGALLTKAPPARGSLTQVLVEANAPQPYVMGAGYYAGVLRHDAGYGATLDGVPNPYRGMAIVYSGGGPVKSITPRVDFGAVPAWYSGYLYTSTQLGSTPQAAALTPQFAGLPGWGTAHKLSGQAAILWNFKFDKAGKKFAGGLPVLGAEIEGVKVYDPRLDSTFPGGSGACRLGQEATYVYTTNPALHAGTYAFGRYQNGKRTMGVGLPGDGIDWATIAAWANVCDANAWTMFGVVFEPGNRWANLKEICVAGGGQPLFSGGLLSFRFHAPVVSIDTVTEADLAEGPMSVTAMQSWRDRLNTIVPKYRSPAHNWEMVPGSPVSVATYLAEDGEEKLQEWAFNFVREGAQAAQLAAYQLVDRRELHPIEITVGPRLRAYRPGDCLQLELPDIGLSTRAIILRRQFNPVTLATTLTLIGETPTKHAFALGQTATPPATPALGQTAETRDLIGGAAQPRWWVGPTAPAGGDGDGWKDTSTTPNRFRLRIGGAWVDVSSLVTDTAQIADGANLGLTALWAGVVGAGRPQDNATRNDEGGNMIAAPLDYSQWVYNSGAAGSTSYTINGSNKCAQLYTAAANVRFGGFVPVRGGDDYYFSYGVVSDFSGSEAINVSYVWKNVAGAEFAVNLSAQTQVTLSEANVYPATLERSVRFKVPDTAVAIQIYVERAVATGGSFFVNSPFLTKAADNLQLSTNFQLGIGSTISQLATATDQGGGTGVTITVPSHSRKLPGKKAKRTVGFNGATWTNRAYNTQYFIYALDPNLAGGSVSWQITTDPDDTLIQSAIHGFTVLTPAAGSAPVYSSGGAGNSTRATWGGDVSGWGISGWAVP